MKNDIIDKNYNYATNMANAKNSLPSINLNLSKIVEFYKNSTNISIDELINAKVLHDGKSIKEVKKINIIDIK